MQVVSEVPYSNNFPANLTLDDHSPSEPTVSNDPLKSQNTWNEEIVIAGNQLVDRVKQLVAEGNVRRLIIRKSSGETLVEIPLSAGVAVGGVFTVMAPILAALSALAALLAEVKIEVIHAGDPPQD